MISIRPSTAPNLENHCSSVKSARIYRLAARLDFTCLLSRPSRHRAGPQGERKTAAFQNGSSPIEVYNLGPTGGVPVVTTIGERVRPNLPP
jgi:hypothetical protein